MNDAKYIGLDVHQATISAAVLDSTGKSVFECIMEGLGKQIFEIGGLAGAYVRVPQMRVRQTCVLCRGAVLAFASY